jgi:tetratricopeptide (TPR) repeat protein
VTYSNESVAAYINDNLVPYLASMGERDAWPIFRVNHVIWTPSVGLADRKGSIHYLSVGFSPPPDFLSALRIGRARCLMAWTRYAEAAGELEQAAAAGNSMVPEALFWLATAYYFEARDTTRMYETWDKLTSLYPQSPWAQHTYPPPAQ